MGIHGRNLIVVWILLVSLYGILGLYALHERDTLFTHDIDVDGISYRVEKLRGFIEPTQQGFNLISGGYRYAMISPPLLEVRTAHFGDSAVYFYDDGDEFVAMHVEHNDYIYLKYLFSFGAFLFVVFHLVRDYRLVWSEHHG